MNTKKTKLIPLHDPVFTLSLDDVIEAAGIQSWDLLIVGDGSGNTWDHECGWSSVALTYNSLERKVFHGAMSHGSNNVGEMMAYLQPLMWYVARERKNRAAGSATRAYNVHILTDSDYLVKTEERRSNMPFWALFDQFPRQGFLLHWHWIRREQIGLNVYVDQLSRMARLLIRDSGLIEESELTGPYPVSVYKCNPS